MKLYTHETVAHAVEKVSGFGTMPFGIKCLGDGVSRFHNDVECM